jgi:purine-binding chemotaxis protein CheW
MTAVENKQYLTFRWQDLQYGIETTLVQEILPLPELTTITEDCSNIIGIINLRGQIVPIMHLDLLQQQQHKIFQLSDYLIVMQIDGLQFGFVVNQVNELLELNAEVVEIDPDLALLTDINTNLIAATAKVEAGNIVLLNPQLLIAQLDAVLTLIWDAQMQLDAIATEVDQQSTQQTNQQNFLQSNSESYSGFLPEITADERVTELQTSNIFANFYELYCPNISLEEREIFQQRAEQLRLPIESLKGTNKLMPLAVINLNNQYFGLDLELVREFTNISNLTSIPCCPNHIVGNMNWRGEIVTLVDIRNVLHLPTTPIGIGSQAVVVQVDDIVAGLPVDQVLEMAYLNSADLKPVSGIFSELGEQYIQGTAFLQEKMLRVLDLPKLFTEGGLAVNEEI